MRRSAKPCAPAFRRDHTNCFCGCHVRLGPGGGAPIEAKRKNQNLQRWKFQKLQNSKTENLENFRRKFVFREIDLEIVLHKIEFVFSRSATKFSLLRLFVSFALFAMCEVYI
jgi:hypothetical protein